MAFTPCDTSHPPLPPSRSLLYKHRMPGKPRKPSLRLLQSAIADLESSQAPVRLAASRSLRLFALAAPELLYPYFDRFDGLLRNQNSVLRWNAILTVAQLAPADHEGRLDLILDAYLSPIPGPRLIDAANTIRGAALIAAARPHLAVRIVEGILQVERAVYATPECRDVAIGHAIEALRRLAEHSGVRDFVSRQLRNPRPATRAKAEKFLRMRVSAARGAGGRYSR